MWPGANELPDRRREFWNAFRTLGSRNETLNSGPARRPPPGGRRGPYELGLGGIAELKRQGGAARYIITYDADKETTERGKFLSW